MSQNKPKNHGGEGSMFNSLVVLHLSLFQIIFGSLCIIIAIVYFHNMFREKLSPKYDVQTVNYMRDALHGFVERKYNLENKEGNSGNSSILNNDSGKDIFKELLLQTYIQAGIEPKQFDSFYTYQKSKLERRLIAKENKNKNN